MPNDPAPVVFEKGQVLRADQLNMIVEMVIARSPMMPGMMRNGAFCVQRPVPGGASVIPVAVIANVPAATWDKTANSGKGDLTQATGSSPLLTAGSGPGKFTYDPNVKIDWINMLATSVTIGSNKFRVGYVVDGYLLQVDCTELDRAL